MARCSGSLGWNFLEYGFTFEEGASSGPGDPRRGFIAMAVVPSGYVRSACSSNAPSTPGSGSRPRGDGDRSAAVVGGIRRIGRSEPPVREAPPAETASEAIERLERLAELRRCGDLTTDEYERFKQALLREAEGAG